MTTQTDHPPQTRHTIEEIRDVIAMPDDVVRKLNPAVVRGIAQRVVDLEQTRMNNEHSMQELEEAAKQAGLTPLVKLALMSAVTPDVLAGAVFEELQSLDETTKRELFRLVRESE